MISQITINGVKAVITYYSNIDLFRGEFVGLNGGADFYVAYEDLRRKGGISLEACQDTTMNRSKHILPKLRRSYPRYQCSQKNLGQWMADVLK